MAALVAFLLLLALRVSPALQERTSTDGREVTCSSDTSTSCSNLSSHAGLLSGDLPDSLPEELLLGRTPHRLSVADTAGIPHLRENCSKIPREAPLSADAHLAADH